MTNKETITTSAGMGNSLNNGFVRVLLFTCFILLIPLVAMQFSDEVNWGVMDFIVMAILCTFAGGALVLATRILPDKRILITTIIVTFSLLVWAELAVGIFTDLGS